MSRSYVSYVRQKLGKQTAIFNSHAPSYQPSIVMLSDWSFSAHEEDVLLKKKRKLVAMLTVNQTIFSFLHVCTR